MSCYNMLRKTQRVYGGSGKANPKVGKWTKDFTYPQSVSWEILMAATKELTEQGLPVFTAPRHVTKWYSTYSAPLHVIPEDSPYLMVLLRVEDGKLSLPDGIIDIFPFNLRPLHKKPIRQTIGRALGKNFKWSGKLDDGMQIQL